jgi:hypothetical protein
MAAAAAFGFGQAASADPIPYPGSGAYNPTTYSFTAAADGDVIAYIVGGFGAGFTNELGLLINGVLSPAGFGLNNHSTVVGDSFNLGHANAGDTLVFVLHNLTVGADAYSDPAMNAAYDDAGVTGHNHIYSTAYTGTSPVFAGVPVGTYVAFEDLPFPDADFNYDDESFVFTNERVTASVVPEPGALALLGLGLGCLAAIRTRRTDPAA